MSADDFNDGIDFVNECEEDIYFYNKLKFFAKKEFDIEEEYVYFGITNDQLLVKDRSFDFYLRRIKEDTRDYKKGTLVIARIGFFEKRQGFGTKLVDLIREMGGRYNYKYLVIEQVNPASKAFALHLGMKDMGENNDERNYIINI